MHEHLWALIQRSSNKHVRLALLFFKIGAHSASINVRGVHSLIRVKVWIELPTLSKVNELKSLALVYEQITRLQVSMHSILAMHEFDSKYDMSSVNPCQINWQRPEVLDKILQGTIRAVLCDKVQVLRVLAGSKVLDGKGVVGKHAQGVTLSEHSIDLTISGNMLLID